MNFLVDKIILLIFSLFIYFNIVELNGLVIIPILLCIICICINSVFNNRHIKFISFLMFFVLSIIYPAYLCFLPIFIYDLFYQRNKTYVVISMIAYFTLLLSSENLIIGLIHLLISFVLSSKNYTLEKLKNDYIILRDNSKETILDLEKEKSNISDREFFEINNAKLEERNSIARDIHDNVGHLLSRSIIQIGAIKTIYSDDEKINTMLEDISVSLNDAMNSIRKSVHKLYNESSNIISELNDIFKDFTFCNINFAYEEEFLNLNTDIKMALISITKEALNNILKHSNATNVNISIKEYNTFLQYIIHDNGNVKSSIDTNGIGIRNMKKRISTLNGYLNISNDDGFRIFINIPYSESLKEDNV